VFVVLWNLMGCFPILFCIIIIIISWCKPCHKVQPFYEQCSSQNYSKEAAAFFTIDVDDFDKIATKYKVAMMPTFLVIQGEQVLGTYRGSNEHELQQFLKEQLSS
jgi:thioredoxin 1